LKRYFLTLAYQGTHYCGWQRQPNAVSVQQTIEEAASIILRHNVEVTGCGRTDTGVHAAYYVAHFDTETTLPDKFLVQMNGILPADIAIYDVKAVKDTAHARFDALERSYRYDIALRKDPFSRETAWFFPQYRKLDQVKMQELATLLLQYSSFFPFCKTNSGVEHYACKMLQAYWEEDLERGKLSFHITANRFLRGMVRMIVGASIQVGLGQITLEEVKMALETQTALAKSQSVPPTGLFLVNVRYSD
jgi:tRNA pseudouridine38-40 synthase